MRYKPGHREQSRQRILDAVGRGFRTAGYGGVGVDGLAKEADVTSGAFYGHFKSKAAAFRAAVAAGLEQLRAGVEALRQQHGAGWVGALADFYLTQKVTCAPGEACALQSLSPEVARADEAARTVYQEELLKVVETVAAGLPATLDEATRRQRAWTLLAQLAGGTMMARAVADPRLSQEIAAAVRAQVAE